MGDTIRDQVAAADQDVTREDTVVVQDQDTIRDAPDQDVIARVDIIPDLDTILGLDTTPEHLWEEFLAGPLDRVDPVTQDRQTRPAAGSTLAINDSCSSFSCYPLTIALGNLILTINQK